MTVPFATVARLALGAALVAVLMVWVDWDMAVQTLRNARLPLIAGALAWVFADRGLNAWTWIVLLKAKVRTLRTAGLMKVHFIATFVGNFVPLNIGADVARVIVTSRISGEAMACLSSVIVLRVLGVLSLLVAVALVLVAATILRVSGIGHTFTWIATAITAAGLLFCGLLAWKRNALAAAVTALVGRHRVWKKLAETFDACRTYEHHTGALLEAFALLQLSLLNAILITYLVGRALSIEVPVGYYFLYVPLITFAGQLPISPNGLGIAEGGYVFFFTQAGASASESLVLAFLMRVLVTIGSLPGGVLLALQGWPTGASAVSVVSSRGEVAGTSPP